MSASLARRDLLRFRMHAQLLAGEQASSPAEVLERMLALQGQDLAAVLWAVGARTRAGQATEGAVLGAMASGDLVRGWPMRGTLHLLPARELGWMLSLTTERLTTGLDQRWANLGLDRAQVERGRDVLHDALRGGAALTRAQVQERLTEAGLEPTGGRGYHLIWFASQTGLVCWGPPGTGEQLLVLNEEWIRDPRRLGREEALAELLVRYVRGHGPATLKDFLHWTKLTAAEGREALALAGDRLERAQLEGTRGVAGQVLLEPSVLPEPGDVPTVVHALPAFDEYLLGFKDKSPVIRREHEPAVVPGGNGVFQPILVSRGRVIGTWGRSTRRGALVPEWRPFGELSAPQTAGAARAFARYARFRELPVAEG